MNFIDKYSSTAFLNPFASRRSPLLCKVTSKDIGLLNHNLHGEYARYGIFNSIKNQLSKHANKQRQTNTMNSRILCGIQNIPTEISKAKDYSQYQSSQMANTGFQIFSVDPSVPLDPPPVLNYALIRPSLTPEVSYFLNCELNYSQCLLRINGTFIRNGTLISSAHSRMIKQQLHETLYKNVELGQVYLRVDPFLGELRACTTLFFSAEYLGSLTRKPLDLSHLLEWEMKKLSSYLNRFLPVHLLVLEELTLAQSERSMDTQDFKPRLSEKETMKQCNYIISRSRIEDPIFIDSESRFAFRKFTSEQLSRRLADSQRELNDFGERLYDPALLVIAGQYGSMAELPSAEKLLTLQNGRLKDSLRLMVKDPYIKEQSRILSNIEVDGIINESQSVRGGFSSVTRLDIAGRRQGEPNSQNITLARKKPNQHQDKRHQNQQKVIEALGVSGQMINYLRYYKSNHQSLADSILMQYVYAGSLSSYYHRFKQFISFEFRLNILYSVAAALRFLRDHQVVHMDLKPGNIVLRQATTRLRNYKIVIPKLIDFGESYFTRVQNVLTNQNRGFTKPYASPQQTKKQGPFTERVDVYAFSVMLYQALLEGFPPDLSRCSEESGHHRKSREVTYVDGLLRHYSIVPEKCRYLGPSDRVRMLYRLCQMGLDEHPRRRPLLDWIYVIFTLQNSVRRV